MPNSSSGSASTASASGNDIWSRVLQSRRQSYEALGNAELEEILYHGGWGDVRREAPPDLQPAARRLEWLLQYYFSVSIDENCSSHKRRHHFHRLNQVLAKIDQMVANRNVGGADAVQFDAVHADREHRAPANRWGPPVRQRSSSFTSQQDNNANVPTPMSIDGSPVSSNSANARVSATNSSLTTQNLASHNAFHNPNGASSSRISEPNTIQNQPCSATTPTYNQPLLNGMHSQYASEKPSSTTAIDAPPALATTNTSSRTLAAATHHLGQTRRERTSLPPNSDIMSSSQPPPNGSARVAASSSLSQLQTNDQSQIATETNGRASDPPNNNDNMLNTATTVPGAPVTLHATTTKVSSPSTPAPPANTLGTSSVQRAPNQMSHQLTAIPQGSSRDRPKTPATPPMNVVSDSSLDSMQSTKPAPPSKNGRRPSPTATDNYAVSGSAPSGSMSSAQGTLPSSSVPLSKPVTALGNTTNNLSQNSISNGIAQTSNLKGIQSTQAGQTLPSKPSEASTVAPSKTSQHSSTLDASARGDTVLEPVSSDSIQMTPLTSKSTRAVTHASNNNLKQTSNTYGSSTSNSDPPSQTSQTPSTMYRSAPKDNSRSSQTQNISTSVESELHEPASRIAQQVSSQQPPAKTIAPLVNGRSTSQGNHEFKNPYARPSHGMQQHQQNPYERRGSHGSTNSDDPQNKASSQNPHRRSADYPSSSTETPLAGSYASLSPTYTRMTFQPRDGVQLSAPGYAPAAVSSARSPHPHDNSNSHRLAEIERSSASQPGVRTHTNSQPNPYSTTSRSDQRNVSSSYSSAGRNLDEPRRNSFDGASRARSTLINGHKEPHAQRKNSGFSNSSKQMLSNPYAPQSRGASTSHPRASAQSHQSHEQARSQGHSNEVYHRRSRSRSPTPIAAPSADAHTNSSSDIREVTGNRSRSRSPTPNFAAEEPRSSTNQVPDRRSARETNLQRASSAPVSNQHIPHPPFGRSFSTNTQSSSRQNETVDEQGTSATVRSGKDIPREISSSKEIMRNGQSKHTQQNSPAASNQAPIALGTKTITIPAEFDRTKAVALYGGLQSRHEAKITFSPFQPSQRDKDHCLSRLAEWEPFWKVDIVSEIGRTWKIDKLERSKNDLSDAPASAAEINFTLLKSGADRIRDWGVPPKSPQSYCQGDCRLLLFMIPVKVDMKKRADTHLWPKGTFLTLDGVPQKLIQRKQQAHDPKLWYGMCEVLDVSQLIKQPLSGHTFQMCCVEQEQYFYCLAICQHVTPANLFVGEPLISLSREEATKRALEFAKPMICLGDDDEDGHQEAAGKVIFSLVCPISKAIMKKPVRGDVCAHFQCFDLLTFLESNVRTSGGRWRCASCEKFLSWRSLRYCGLTAVLLKEFEGLSSVVRDRVEFRADGKYRLLDETKARYNKKRKVASEIVTSSSNKRPTISTAQDAIEIEDDD